MVGASRREQMGALRTNIGSYPGVRKSQIGFVCMPRAFPFAGSLRWTDAFLLRGATAADAPGCASARRSAIASGAVGTIIAEPPPHKSVQPRLPLRLLPFVPAHQAAL